MKLPAFLEEIKPLIDPKVFKSLDWARIVPKLTLAVTPWNAKGARDKASKWLSPLLPPTIVLTLKSSDQSRPMDSLSRAERTEMGHRLLVTYFLQLCSPQGILLDLRPSSLRYLAPTKGNPRAKLAPTPDAMEWSPMPLVWKLEESFQGSILQMYEGHYTGKSELFESAIRELGLVGKSTDSAGLTLVASAFRQHFGHSDKDSVEPLVSFRLADFNKSFRAIFESIQSSGGRIPSEFTAVGIALVTLYLSLEKLSVDSGKSAQEPLKFNPKAAYLEAKALAAKAGA